ncbi:hypothetical protein, partial [Plasmodium yoelii yoelii]
FLYFIGENYLLNINYICATFRIFN